MGLKNDILYELARRDIRYFVKATQKDYIFAQFNKEILQALSQFYEDVKAEKRPILIIQAPPQHGKSELISRKFPAYIFGKDPNMRIAGCSYSADLATSINRDIQRIMLSDKYQAIFPNTSLNTVRSVTRDNVPLRNSERFDIVGKKGYYICAGVGGPLTGKSVDIGIIDDPVKNMQEARSEAVQKFLTEWYGTVFLTRLSKASGQLIMATRWHENDLIGHIIKKAGDSRRIKILKYPAISEDNKVLIPQLHPLEKLNEQKAVMNIYEWEALYQQNPIVEGGNVIKTDKFRRWKELPQFVYTKIFGDTAMTAKTSSDYSVFALVGFTASRDAYLIDLWRGKWESPELLNMAYALWNQCQGRADIPKPRAIAIENKASGIGLIQELRRGNPRLNRPKLPVQLLEPKAKDAKGNLYVADKFTRLCDVLPDIEVGYYHVPHDDLNKPWLKDFIDECQRFKADMTHSHDDQVDAAVIYPLKERQTGFFNPNF